jgi:L-2-hydroxycarboxylate dehydrogenase (NAD+)
MCFAVPADKELPFILDMATTTAAAGKLEIAARHADPIPFGWALNENAEPTADPRVAQKARRLLPLGGSREGGSHKGYGLAIVVEILCGVLTGTITALNENQDPRGHFFGAIRIDSFRPADEFKRDMDRLVRELKSTPPVEGQARVYVAGEIEFETANERAANGIPLHDSVLKGLRDVSEQLGVPYDLE